MDSKIKGVPRAPNTPGPKSQDDDDNDNDQPPKIEPGYDSSDDKDSDDEPDEPPVRPLPPLMKSSGDDEDTVIIEDVLEDDKLLEYFEEEADISAEPQGRGMRTRAPPAHYQTSFNRLTGTGAYMRPFFDELH